MKHFRCFWNTCFTPNSVWARIWAFWLFCSFFQIEFQHVKKRIKYVVFQSGWPTTYRNVHPRNSGILLVKPFSDFVPNYQWAKYPWLFAVCRRWYHPVLFRDYFISHEILESRNIFTNEYFMVTTSCQGFVWTLLKWQMCCCPRLNSHCYPMVGINSSNLVNAVDEIIPDIRSFLSILAHTDTRDYTSTRIGIATSNHIYIYENLPQHITTIYSCEQWAKTLVVHKNIILPRYMMNLTSCYKDSYESTSVNNISLLNSHTISNNSPQI